VLSLTTYLTGSLLYLYLPMIPDLAILRDSDRFTGWRHHVYSALAVNWRGTRRQHERLERAISVMAIAILPVAVSIHTVTAWLFGMTLRPGWHTTIIGPDFVVGALYSGVAAVITAIVLFRHFLKLKAYITHDHLHKLARLLLVFGFVYAYFVINEHVGEVYTGEGLEKPLSEAIFQGHYATQFWSMVGVGLAAPIALLLTPAGKNTTGITVASILVNIGMWLKRYIIVVPTLASPLMPPVAAKLAYVPTWEEWSITAGAFAVFCLLYIVFAKLFPIISIWEVQEHQKAGELAGAAPTDRPAIGAGREALA
jgi:molybdopterin-containing oxidoreductase family membrane subunit